MDHKDSDYFIQQAHPELPFAEALKAYEEMPDLRGGMFFKFVSFIKQKQSYA